MVRVGVSRSAAALRSGKVTSNDGWLFWKGEPAYYTTCQESTGQLEYRQWRLDDIKTALSRRGFDPAGLAPQAIENWAASVLQKQKIKTQDTRCCLEWNSAAVGTCRPQLLMETQKPSHSRAEGSGTGNTGMAETKHVGYHFENKEMQENGPMLFYNNQSLYLYATGKEMTQKDVRDHQTGHNPGTACSLEEYAERNLLRATALDSVTGRVGVTWRTSALMVFEMPEGWVALKGRQPVWLEYGLVHRDPQSGQLWPVLDFMGKPLTAKMLATMVGCLDIMGVSSPITSSGSFVEGSLQMLQKYYKTAFEANYLKDRSSDKRDGPKTSLVVRRGLSAAHSNLAANTCKQVQELQERIDQQSNTGLAVGASSSMPRQAGKQVAAPRLSSPSTPTRQGPPPSRTEHSLRSNTGVLPSQRRFTKLPPSRSSSQTGVTGGSFHPKLGSVFENNNDNYASQGQGPLLQSPIPSIPPNRNTFPQAVLRHDGSEFGNNDSRRGWPVASGVAQQPSPRPSSRPLAQQPHPAYPWDTTVRYNNNTNG